MRNLGIRLILWFVAVPAIVAIVILLPFRNHLALNIMVVVFSGLGARELANLFERKDGRYRASEVVIPLLGASIPATQLLVQTFGLAQSLVSVVLVSVAGIVLFVQIFRHTADGFRHTLTNTAANFTVLFYPGLFLSFIIRFNEFPGSTVLVLTFLCAVFFNDTMAYIVGGLYRGIRDRLARRKGSQWSPRYVFPVSPKKTVAGFVGGFVMAPAVLAASRALFPDALPHSWGRIIVIGCAVGAATIVGDLIESAIKRSATSKNSGELIPGRGGVLDSVDSVLYAAPVFYYLLLYLS